MHFGIEFGYWEVKNWDFGMKMDFPVKHNFLQNVFTRQASWWRAATVFTRQASCSVAVSHVSRSYVLFAYFCSELASDFNMKVLDSDVGFGLT